MKTTMVNLVSIMSMMFLINCGGEKVYFHYDRHNSIESVFFDPAIIRGKVSVVVSNEPQNTILSKVTSTTTVNYSNAQSVSFVVNTGSITVGTFSGETLSLGSVNITNLIDNDLKNCGVGGNQKCNNAAIRIYTTGSLAGFVNSLDSYGVPIYAGGLNPTTPIGLTVSGAVQTATYVIPLNKNKIRASDFGTLVFPLTSDFSNAGMGSYTVTLVIEYVLLP